MAMMSNEETIFRAQCELVRAGMLGFDEDGMEPIHTFEHWKSLGYSVMKGQKAICKLPIWKQGTKKPKEGEEKGKSYFFLKEAAFFKASQVAPLAAK